MSDVFNYSKIHQAGDEILDEVQALRTTMQKIQSITTTLKTSRRLAACAPIPDLKVLAAIAEVLSSTTELAAGVESLEKQARAVERATSKLAKLTIPERKDIVAKSADGLTGSAKLCDRAKYLIVNGPIPLDMRKRMTMPGVVMIVDPATNRFVIHLVSNFNKSYHGLINRLRRGSAGGVFARAMKGDMNVIWHWWPADDVSEAKRTMADMYRLNKDNRDYLNSYHAEHVITY